MQWQNVINITFTHFETKFYEILLIDLNASLRPFMREKFLKSLISSKVKESWQNCSIMHTNTSSWMNRHAQNTWS